MSCLLLSESAGTCQKKLLALGSNPPFVVLAARLSAAYFVSGLSCSFVTCAGSGRVHCLNWSNNFQSLCLAEYLPTQPSSPLVGVLLLLAFASGCCANLPLLLAEAEEFGQLFPKGDLVFVNPAVVHIATPQIKPLALIILRQSCRGSLLFSVGFVQ